MNVFYIYDGQNEAGPFSVAELKKLRLTRNTPIRQKDSNKWMPAEKLPELNSTVAPRKIKHPKDILPVAAERATNLHRQRPKTLYGILLILALLLAFSFYPTKKAPSADGPKQVVESAPQMVSFREAMPADLPKPKYKKEEKPAPVIKATVSKEDATKASRLRWNKLVSASNSNYGIGFFGGIKDLSVLVTNASDYPLDEVIANVTYIKANGSVWKTVPITLYAVPPHESKEQSVPDASRGKKVKVSLYKVVSRKMKFSYIEGEKGKDIGDPYYKES